MNHCVPLTFPNRALQSGEDGSFLRERRTPLCSEMHGFTQSTTAPLLSQEIAGTRCLHTACRHSHSNLINLCRGVISAQREIYNGVARGPDSYRSLYLSRAISLQMGLKLMAFDTTMSSTLNPSGFIALTFQKVGLCVLRATELGDI